MGVIQMSDVQTASWVQLKLESDRQKPKDLITIGSSHPFLEALKDNAWEGQRCFIVGGGASLKDFDWNILKDELTIGINKAFIKFSPTIVFSMDNRFYQWIVNGTLGEDIKKKFEDYKGFKVWLNTANHKYPDDVYLIDNAGEKAFTKSLKEGLGHGNNSGYAALNLACCLGANPIYLLGFDMKGDGQKQMWWHDGYPVVQKESVFDKFKNCFDRAASVIKERKFRVINVNKDSALKCFEFGAVPKFEKKKMPLIISFYTKNTGYEKEIENLKKSIKLFNLEHHIEGVDNLGNWGKNTRYKTVFIRNMLDKFPNRNLLWLDADAIIRQYPILFESIDADLAFHMMNDVELLSGTLYIANNKTVKDFLDKLIAENERCFSTHDQKILQRVLEEWEHNLKISYLPAVYTQIFDSMKDAGEPVIEHFQASRRFKKEVSNG